jgi:hypothetical protein
LFSFDVGQGSKWWLTLLLHIQKVLVSNLGPENGYHDWAFSRFPSVPPGKCWDSTLKIRSWPLPSKSFQFISDLSPYHLTVYSLCYWKIVVNKLQINMGQWMKSIFCLPALHSFFYVL